jgi:hypothetical protein
MLIQRALSGSVFAEQRMDLTAFQAAGHPVIGQDGRNSLVMFSISMM